MKYVFDGKATRQVISEDDGFYYLAGENGYPASMIISKKVKLLVLEDVPTVLQYEPWDYCVETG